MLHSLVPFNCSVVLVMRLALAVLLISDTEYQNSGFRLSEHPNSDLRVIWAPDQGTQTMRLLNDFREIIGH